MNPRPKKIAVIGGGPAGAVCAERLARRDREVVVYEGRPGWDKPCAGGLTPALFDEHPWLLELDSKCNKVERATMTFPSGKLDMSLKRKLRIIDRRELNGFLQRRAQNAGALWREGFARRIEQHRDRIVVDGEKYDFVVGADGANSTVRRMVGRPLRREDWAIGVGLYVGETMEPRLVVRMLPDLAAYAWIFPALDRCSVGIMAPVGIATRHEMLKRVRGLANDYFSASAVDSAESFAALLPAVRGGLLFSAELVGERFALVGDAAGLCDPFSGEGIRWAVTSGSLAGRAIALGDTSLYARALDENILPELNASSRLVSRLMRRGPMMLAGVLAPRSGTLESTLSEFVSGSLAYEQLKRTFKRRAAKILRQALFNFYCVQR